MNTETPVNKEQQEAAIVAINIKQHQQWLQHPTTQQMFKLLNAHEESVINAQQASPESILSAVRTIRAMRQIFASSDRFTELLSKLN